jgi:hypothetical protein
VVAQDSADRRVCGFAAGHRRPATLLDEGALLPGVHLLEFNQVRGSVGAVLKLIDADGRKCRYESGADAFLRHLFRRPAGDPAAPIETDNQGCDGTGSRALQETGGRISVKDRW